MNICSNRHDEIVFEGRDCPLCIASEKIEELELRISQLEFGQ